MSWALISDSSCNLRDWQPTAPRTTFAFAPLKIRVGEREFVDDLLLDVHELNVAIQSEASASSSACPSVGEWAELFKLADKTICMPISEGVSGSYNAAATARDMVLAEEPNRQIHLVNSRAAGGKMDLIFLLFDRYLASNPDVSFEDACAYFDSLEQTARFSLACVITRTLQRQDAFLRQPASLPTSSIFAFWARRARPVNRARRAHAWRKEDAQQDHRHHGSRRFYGRRGRYRPCRE